MYPYLVYYYYCFKFSYMTEKPTRLETGAVVTKTEIAQKTTLDCPNLNTYSTVNNVAMKQSLK
jgi:hypothetical protein